jgi:hypothetical protein
MQERKLIREHEDYREKVYFDTVGVPTGGCQQPTQSLTVMGGVSLWMIE